MDEEGVTVAVQEHIRHEAKKNFILNLVLNALIPYGMLYGMAEVSAWGEKGYGWDLILTAFLLCTILAGIFIALTRNKAQKGVVIPDGNEGQALTWILPFNPWIAAPWMGLLGICVAVPPLLGLFALLGVSSLPPIAYAAIKGVWAGLLAVIVVSISIRQGMRLQKE